MRGFGKIFPFIFMALCLIIIIRHLAEDKEEEKFNINNLVQEIENNNVEKIIVDGTEVKVSLKVDTKNEEKKGEDKKEEKIFEKESKESLAELLINMGIDSKTLRNLEIEVDESVSVFGIIIQLLFPIMLFAFIFAPMLLKKGAGSIFSIGKSQAKQFHGENVKTSFKDVAGVDEAKAELKEVISFLKEPKKFTDLGAKIPRGTLLVGSPGTGKTLLAKAVAGEAHVPFFYVSGSTFVEMFVGVGASRVRDLFKQAKQCAPSIIFIDEIDAVGRARGQGVQSGGHDEREQTLNQILVEMDGFEDSQNVIIISATNRPDVLDPALLRTGRFDRQVIVDPPDVKGRKQILEVHSKNKPLSTDVDFKEIAVRTSGFSGADLANLMNESAISAARQEHNSIRHLTILNSIEKVMVGTERKSRVMTDKNKKITAYHEAGHALISYFLEKANPVHKISIIPRGRAAGYCINIPEEDNQMPSKSELIAELSVLLGGYCAEKLIFGDVTIGSSNDLSRMTKLARDLVTKHAMGDDLPVRTFFTNFDYSDNSNQNCFSEENSKKIDKAIDTVVENALKLTKETLKEKKIYLEKIAQALIEKETLEKEEFEQLMKEVI